MTKTTALQLMIAATIFQGCYSMGMDDLYTEHAQRNLDAIRGYRSNYDLPPAAMLLAERECSIGSGDVAMVVSERCSALRGALLALGSIRQGLKDDITSDGYVNFARVIGELALKRSRANEEAWAEAIQFNVENPYSEGHYDGGSALDLVSKAATACEVDSALVVRARALLDLAKEQSYPGSYRALAVEVNAAVELAVAPRGSLNSYRQALAYSDQSLDRARLTASAEPEPRASVDAPAAADTSAVPSP